MARATADVVIIGGGIMGMSIAHQVARRSTLDIVVLEKGAGLGEGSTGASSAITRQRYSRVENIRLARDANHVFGNWAEFTELPSPRAVYHQVGCLWMMSPDPAVVADDCHRLRAEGVDAVVLDRTELTERFPSLSACMRPLDLSGEMPHECSDGDAFLLEQDSGYFDATGALEDVAEAARTRSVDVRMGRRVVAVRVHGGRASGVELDDGSRIDAGLIVNAAGPWCNEVNRMAGLDLSWDLVPTRVQVIYRDLPVEVPAPIPVVGDATTGIYFRPESGGRQLLLGSVLEVDEQEQVDPDDYRTSADRSWIDTKIHALHHRIPGLPHRGDVRGLAGVYTVNRQDVHPVIGTTPLDGFAVTNGFSGHGFKESPMVGSMMAQWITRERASFDTDVPMSFYAIDRTPIQLEDHNVLA